MQLGTSTRIHCFLFKVYARHNILDDGHKFMNGDKNVIAGPEENVFLQGVEGRGGKGWRGERGGEVRGVER